MSVWTHDARRRAVIAARSWLGWTQTDLARRAGVGRGVIADYERGRHRKMRGDGLVRVVETLERHGVTVRPNCIYFTKRST